MSIRELKNLDQENIITGKRNSKQNLNSGDSSDTIVILQDRTGGIPISEIADRASKYQDFLEKGTNSVKSEKISKEVTSDESDSESGGDSEPLNEAILSYREEEQKEQIKIETPYIPINLSGQKNLSRTLENLFLEKSFNSEVTFKTEQKMSKLQKLAKEYIAANLSEKEKIYKTLKQEELKEFMSMVLNEEGLDPLLRTTINERLNQLEKIQLDLNQRGSTSTDRTSKIGPQQIETNRRFKLDKTTKIFKGTSGEDIKNWIFNVETNMKLNFIEDDKDKVLAVLNFLEGSPFQHYKRYINQCYTNGTEPSWRAFKKNLTELYSNQSMELDVRKRLRNFKTFGEYNDEFLNLISSIDDMPDIELVDKYLWFRPTTILKNRD